MIDSKQMRIFLLVALAMVTSLLLSKWQEQQVKERPTTTQKSESTVPHIKLSGDAFQTSKTKTQLNATNHLISIKTALMSLKIDLLGGDIVELDLTQHKGEEDESLYRLFSQSKQRYFYAQSGLTGPLGPDSPESGRALFTSKALTYDFSGHRYSEGEEMTLELRSDDPEHHLSFVKTYTFKPDSYLIDVSYKIENKSSMVYEGRMYGRLKRQAQKSSYGWQNIGIRTFTGIAVTTPEKPYKKISFEDVRKKPLQYDMKGGWISMIEHYFLSAWIPDAHQQNTYLTENLENNTYGVSFVSPLITVQPGAVENVKASLYVGPESTAVLAKISPNLELTVDYGMFWVVCQPIFWLLRNIYEIVGNWGIAIICTTCAIKIFLLGISSSGYKSMANMKKLQPRIESLKKSYGDDKQGFGQAVLELYRKEKVNPFGGCLPWMIQIPVFLSLYYVLLSSVELRNAPFILWITDLSAKDPYYVLPIIMGGTMFLQQKLMPTQVQDPAMAKVMTFMPLVLTALFLNFPSGLVLYWIVNNILSIIQQWYITKKVEQNLPA